MEDAMTSRSIRRLIALGTLCTLLSAPPAVLGQATPPATSGSAAPSVGQAAVPAEGAWPREIQANGATVLVYQPQIDSWQGNRLEARAAVAIRRPGAAQPSFGVVWITARTEIDKERGMVVLEDIQIRKVNAPASPQRNAEFLRAARQHIPADVKTVPLEQFEANLAIGQAETKTMGMPVVNDPPRIIVSATPALLVRIDGQPSLRQMPGSALLRVINTRGLILLDPSTGGYYVAARGRWWVANTIDGPWAPAVNAPAALEDAKRAAVAAGQVDLLDAPPGEAPGAAPTIYVSTVRAELVVMNGPPTWSPIAGTELLYATNTSAHVFLELKAQQVYVLISGRWFRAPSTDGPWQYVPGTQLPSDFAKIPEQGPSGVVLASVPGTPQAQEAVIANSIPQTATVVRSAATFTATYDGPPQWRPISGTPLAYAANSPTPIIRVDAKTYYALYNGVWFVTTAPVGPWAVATVVPAVIYTIPVTSPLHYVTYVRVYGVTPTLVYVGYTPGYLGTVVAPDGVVVYGTGVVYTPWVGTVWYPPPPTYGTGTAFAWGATTGFVMGAMTTAAVWGCCASSSTTTVNVNKTTYNYNNGNVYSSWSKTTATSGDKSATVYSGPDSKVVTNNQNNNVYASHDGNVYKKQDGTWDKWNSSSGWQPVNTSSAQATTSAQTAPGSTSSQSPSAESESTRRQSAQQQAQQRQGGQAPGAPSTQSQPPGSTRTRPEQPGAGQGLGGQQGTGQGFGGQRSEGQGGFAGLGQRFGGSGGFQGFGQRSSGGGLEGLENESAARERGFSRFSGARAGGLRR
jgi:hypothetical protein